GGAPAPRGTRARYAGRARRVQVLPRHAEAHPELVLEAADGRPGPRVEDLVRSGDGHGLDAGRP
ncbi:MAG: hypothetical protein ACRDQ9_15350, partial [Pseudonocardiaceae bacterium]